MIMIEDSNVNTIQGPVKLRHLLISVLLSVVIVGLLVGNAYMEFNIGYPRFLQPVGEALVWVGLVVAVPPWSILWVLNKIGITWELRGRESFIESNLWLWIYCACFYAFAIYLTLRFKHRRNQKKKQILELRKG